MRIRCIKPEILTNTDLAEMGPYAYILFTALWMLADREGRFEFNPKRIRVMTMAVWGNFSDEDFMEIIWKLVAKEMLVIYNVNGGRYGQIVNWAKHQRPHVRENPSRIPPVSAADSIVCEDGTTKAVPEHNLGDCQHAREPGTGNRSSTVSFTSKAASFRKVRKPFSPPPPLNGTQKTQRAPSAKTTPPKKPPQRSPTHRRADGEHAPVENVEPHAPADYCAVRDSLNELARMVHMPPPDHALILRVLDAGHGATGDVIHATLVELYKRRRFAEIRSWGLVPLVVGNCFAAAESG